ncbi:MAG: DNA translocase FtsK [Anaerolineae bacterium]|nr:DNA translocase FtsK [Anaerolineae bacterium]
MSRGQATRRAPTSRSGEQGKGRQRKGERRRSQPTVHIHLTLDQKLDLLGYLLLAVAAFTILSFLSSSRGLITGKWLELLRLGFGWGAYLTPLFVGAVGLWLVLRDFGDRLPRLTPLQIIGVALGYPALLVSSHLIAAPALFHGDLVATARAGHGGGYLGAALSKALLDGLGTAGTVVLLVTWWLIVMMLLFGVTARELVQAFQRPLLPGDKNRAESPVPARPSVPSPVSPSPSPSPPPRPQAPSTSPKPAAPAPPAPSAVPTPPRVIGGEHSWQLPPLDEILEPGADQDISASFLRRQARIIEETLESLGAPVWVREMNPGPVVTQFAVEPRVITTGNGVETRVKVSRIKALADDLALALEAKTLRIEAPIPGKGLIGIEVPNPEIAMVALRDVIESEQFAALDSPLRICLGQDVSGTPYVADLTAMPHLLIAGTTGSGKSVCINAIIATLLLQRTPDELKFLMVDPKRVELTGYEGIPHLLAKVVVEMERVPGALQWILREMDGRYRHFAEVRATNIRDYNERIAPQRGLNRMPYIVVVIDELADLMMMAPQETERAICRIAQMARATGIHLVIATQRPSVDVVTGLIKANFPARIAFNVASSVDSRVILDMPGAEQLLGRGDMLYLPPDAPTPIRLQGAYVSDEELRRLVHFWKAQSKPGAMALEKPVQQPLWEEMRQQQEKAAEFEDELLPEVLELVLREQRASISLLQRKLRIGYTRAARIMEILEQHNVVGPQPPGGQAREVFPAAARALLNPKKD